MPVTQAPFESKFGFNSPNFSVDQDGNVVVSSLVIAPQSGEQGILNVDNIRVKGVQLIEGGESSTISLGDQITQSNLETLGTLQFLNIDGDFTISEGSTPYFSVLDGVVNIESSSNIGRIDNMEIGLSTPRAASFSSVNIGPGDSAGELSVQGNIIGTADFELDNNARIEGYMRSGSVETELLTSDNISINNLPTDISHATRKDYVDSRVIAFSVAFGA